MTTPEINIRSITPIRCDIDTHCDISVKTQRDKRKIKLNSGITVTTDAEKVAEIVGIPAKPKYTEATPETKKRTWEIAVGRAVSIIGFMHKEDPVTADRTTITLFDDLRDPDRRERVVQKIDASYKEYVSAAREPVGVMEPEANGQIIQFPTEAVVFNSSKS